MSPHRHRKVSVFAVVFLASSGLALAQTPESSQNKPPADPSTRSHADSTAMSGSSADRTFAHKAAMGGMMEVEAGKIALEKSSDPKVKEFAQRMVDDHSRANEQLKAAAAEEGITLPTRVEGKPKKSLDKLRSLSGARFDEAYKKMMVADHKEDVALFEKEAGSRETSATGSSHTSAGMAPGESAPGQDMSEPSAVKRFASETLPTLREHLQMAEDMAGSKTASTGH